MQFVAALDTIPTRANSLASLMDLIQFALCRKGPFLIEGTMV